MLIDQLKQINSETASRRGAETTAFGADIAGGGLKTQADEAKKAGSAAQMGSGAVFSVDESRKLKKVTYGRGGDEDEKKDLDDIMDQASGLDAVAMKNEMVVGAKTITGEDAKKLADDGFLLRDTDIHTVVTVTDKIKAAMAASGADMGAMGGVDEAVLEELRSGGGVMAAITAGLSAADMPGGDERAQEINSGVNMVLESAAAAQLTDAAKEYLIGQSLEPTAVNVGQAMSISGMTGENGQGAGAVQNTAEWSEPELTAAIDSVFAREHIADTSDNRSAALWLMERELPVNYENIIYKRQLDTGLAVNPLNTEAENRAIATALIINAGADGIDPKDVVLLPERTPDGKALATLSVIREASDEDVRILTDSDSVLSVSQLKRVREEREAGEGSDGDAQKRGNGHGGFTGENRNVETDEKPELIRNRRLLEETRLVMSLEANKNLLKKGLSIDTVELSRLVEELKKAEQDYYKSMVDPAGENPGLAGELKRILNTAEELKILPAVAIGSASFNGHTLENLHAAGVAVRNSFAEASQRYELMSTKIMSEFGDSVSKAVQNVDNILEDLGYEKNEANARAVRIVAYNTIELNHTNIDKIKEADQLVQKAFDSLKPAVVSEFIKKGINPLSMDMRELVQRAEEVKEALPAFDETERFAQYLWRIEHDGGISQEERDSYIGIYRLIRQVEKTDGAAVGAVVETNRELTMENLLSAVRTKKRGSMDYKIDDDFEGVDKTTFGKSVTDQINRAFSMLGGQLNDGGDSRGEGENSEGSETTTKDSGKTADNTKVNSNINNNGLMEPEGYDETEYYDAMLEDLKIASQAPAEVYNVVQTFEITPTPDNIIVIEQMMTDPSSGLKRFFSYMDNALDTAKRERERVAVDDLSDGGDEDDILEQISSVKQDILEAFGEHVKNPEELADALETLASVAEHCGQTFIREGMTTLDLRQLQLAVKQLSVTSNLARNFHYNVPVMTEEGVTNVSLKLVRGAEESGTLSVFTESEKYGRLSARITLTDGEARGYIASDSRAGADELRSRIGELPGRIDILFSNDVRDQAYSLPNSPEDSDVGALYDLGIEIIKFMRR